MIGAVVMIGASAMSGAHSRNRRRASSGGAAADDALPITEAQVRSTQTKRGRRVTAW
jgi:hypothetical protein